MSVQHPEDDLAALWRRVRAELEASFPASTFDLWFDPIRAVSRQGETVFLSATPSVRAWVERRYGGRLLDVVARLAPDISAIAFVDGTAKPTVDAPKSQPLNDSHTFERFVIGPGNRLAHAAALAVAELPGEAYNPLFLHGPPGLGKTHLLGAIVEYLERSHPELQIHYTTAERFTTEFVASLRRDGPEAFKARYRELDALLIDDVQVLEGKLHTEEEFVHTFNTLHARASRSSSRATARPRRSRAWRIACATVSSGAFASKSSRRICGRGSRSSGAWRQTRSNRPSRGSCRKSPPTYLRTCARSKAR